MSKNKGGKNVKKAPAVQGKKAVSDYQAGKKPDAKIDASLVKKN